MTIAERTHNTRYKIELLALRALALNCQSETSQADAALKQAIELSRPGGFIRVFVDLGTPMRAMLSQLANQGYSVEAIRPILAAFPSDEKDWDGRERLGSVRASPIGWKFDFG